MTLSSMLADLYRKHRYAASPASDVTTRLTAFLNEAQQVLISTPGLGEWLLQHVPALTFASTASRAIYSLPPTVPRIESIRESTNDQRLEMRSRDWYRTVEPDTTANTGTPEVWVPMGFSATEQPPSNASEIFVDSTSAGDTNTAYIEVVRSGGHPQTISVTMTGTTAVTFSASVTDVVAITKFYLSAVAVGDVTLHEDASGGTELARIGAGNTFSRYLQIALWPTPASAITYTVDGERDIPDLFNANDQPLWPPRFHRLLVDYASYLEWTGKDDDRAAQAYRDYERGLSALKYFVTCPPDSLPVASGERGEPRSRLGANYPSGAGWI